MYQTVHTIASWKQIVPELVLNCQLTICAIQGLHSHTQRARLQRCIAVTKNTQTHESTRGYMRRVYTCFGSPPYNTMVYYPKLKSNYVHHCWETWYHLTSSQLPSGLSAGPMFKWRGCRMRIGNQNKTSRWNTLIF